MALYINPQNIVTYNTIYTAGANSMYGQHFELPINANLSLGDKLEWKCAVWRNNYVNDWVEIQNIESTGNLPYMGSYKVHTLEFNNGNGYRSLTNKNFYTNYITANSARLFVFDFSGDYSGNITKFTNEYENDRSVSCAYSYIKIIDSNDNIKECWIPTINNNIIGMYDTISKRFIPVVSDSYTQGLATVEGVISEVINGSISYLAYATSNNQLVFPKKLYWANSSNSVQLVYVRPVKNLHIINLAINTKLGNANKVSEIKFTNNLNLRNLAYDDNVVDVTYQNNIPTYEFLVQNDDNTTFTCYIANAFWGENSKIYCYGDFGRCFMNCSILTTIPVSNFDTSNVTSMYMFFEACTNATTIDVSNFDTSNVTTFFCMFRECRNVTELNVSNFNTSKSTSIAWMFNGCRNVTELDVSNFDTSRCTSMYALFQGCNKITELDVSHFDTGKVTDMYAMFSNCLKLESLDVSNFDTSKVTNMQFMFTNLQSIKRLDISNFNLSSVTNFSSFIRNCYELKYLKLPLFNTLNAIDCSFMFCDIPKITSLNLDGFSTNNCESIIYLFNNNQSLRRIFTNTFDTSSLKNSDPFQEGILRPGDFNMFFNNIAIKGGNGTTYNYNHIDSEYARIDGENGLQGYFTDPAEAIKITLINVDNENYTDKIYLCAGDTYTIPTLQGYTAVVTDNNGNTYSDGDTITITQNITLTFVWSAVNNN